MKFLYARISTNDGSQNIDRQTINKEDYDEVFEDYASGVSTTNRPRLQELLKWVRTGDVIEVHSIDRLARNVTDLLNIIKIITEERKAEIYFIKENLRFTNDLDNPFNKLMLQMVGSIAEFERNIIRSRQREGIAIAKAKGVYSKERRRKVSGNRMEELKKDVANGIKTKDICKKFGITERTFYRYRKKDLI